jgi:hypothetical protein
MPVEQQKRRFMSESNNGTGENVSQQSPVSLTTSTSNGSVRPSRRISVVTVPSRKMKMSVRSSS